MGPKGKGAGGGKGTGAAGGHVRSPSAQRELNVSQAATQAARQFAAQLQQQLQASQQQLQQVLAGEAPSVPLGRTASGHSSRLATQAQAAAPSLPLTLGASGYYIHPTKGTMPHIVTPTLPTFTATASHARVVRPTSSAGYAHPSLGVMQNVMIPVPVSNAQLAAVQQQHQGLLTTVPAISAPNPLFSIAPAPPLHALSVGSTSSSQQTIVHGGAMQTPLQACHSRNQHLSWCLDMRAGMHTHHRLPHIVSSSLWQHSRLSS